MMQSKCFLLPLFCTIIQLLLTAFRLLYPVSYISSRHETYSREAT